MKRRNGRPPKLPTDLTLISVDAAVDLIKSEAEKRFEDKTVAKRKCKSKKTLYNLRSTGFLTAYYTGAIALFDRDEIIRKLCA